MAEQQEQRDKGDPLAWSAHAAATPAQTQVPLTPQQAASQVLKAVGPSTRVGVQRTVTVAGQPAYQLVLSPSPAGRWSAG